MTDDLRICSNAKYCTSKCAHKTIHKRSRLGCCVSGQKNGYCNVFVSKDGKISRVYPAQSNSVCREPTVEDLLEL
jgi:hypothetical protein